MKSWQTFSIHDRPRNRRLFLLLLGLMLLAAVLSLCLGPVSISPVEVLRALLGRAEQ